MARETAQTGVSVLHGVAVCSEDTLVCDDLRDDFVAASAVLQRIERDTRRGRTIFPAAAGNLCAHLSKPFVQKTDFVARANRSDTTQYFRTSLAGGM